MSRFWHATMSRDRLRSVLVQVLRGDDGPDHGYLVLVHGLGGIGKTTLLEQYRRIVDGERWPRSQVPRSIPARRGGLGGLAPQRPKSISA